MNSLTRYSPQTTFSSLRREMDRLFEQFTQGDGDGHSLQWMPRADLSETDDQYIIRMDVPGLRKEDVHVELHSDTLTVRGERRSEHEEKNENLHRIERSYGHFFRSFTLPHASNVDGVRATMEDGVLVVEVPKAEESKPRRIEIS